MYYNHYMINYQDTAVDQPNLLFERLRLQAHFRRVFDDLGQEAGWQLIRRAVELESTRYQTHQEDSDAPGH
jgi:hypothetical protein